MRVFSYKPILCLSMFAIIVGCKPKTDVEVKTNRYVTSDSNDISQDGNGCGLLIHLAHEINAENHYYSTLFLKYAKGVVKFSYINGDIFRVSKNKFVRIDYSQISKPFEYNSHEGEQLWNKYIAHPLWGGNDVIFFERPGDIIGEIYDKQKDKSIRAAYKEIPPNHFPLAGEKGYVDAPSAFYDNSEVIGYYKNVLFFYDTFSIRNLDMDCEFASEERNCINTACVSHVSAYIFTVGPDGALNVKKHVSDSPEFYDGERFYSIFSEPISLDFSDKYTIVKESNFPMFEKNSHRTFSFYPYPTNPEYMKDEGILKGSTLVATRANSFGNAEVPCHDFHAYDLYGVSNEESIILNIPDDKLPPTVANIRDEISKAPNGCGYIDWEKQEIVFGEMHQKADWLPFVNGIYWLDEDEEFPIERFNGKDDDKTGSVENKSDKDDPIRTGHGALRGFPAKGVGGYLLANSAVGGIAPSYKDNSSDIP